MKPAPARIGRPRSRARRIRKEFRCTPDQKAALHRIAESRGLSMGELFDQFIATKYASTTTA